MSSGSVQSWFVFGELIAPPPPLLNIIRPGCSGGLGAKLALLRTTRTHARVMRLCGWRK
jgi:hypothetical protein